ncbi:MAG TPA: mechanosensitive ion channel [bacterium]|nr:mechanosensitive ion channel [bacterium]HNZ54425.1 mechanosensitive ion channel [bacterium]HOB71829.1 mechanosensitive ion channel [bacterium]HPG36302.1 mechanosensitive ion channel [bacterium]HPM46682.1 mechanosensitive ion channel [bacterium]
MKSIFTVLSFIIAINAGNSENCQSIDKRYVEEDFFNIDKVSFAEELEKPSETQSEKLPESDDAENKNPVSGTIIDSKPQIEWKVSFGKVFWMIIIFLFAYMLIKYFTKALEAIAEKWAASRLFIKRVIPVFRLSGWIATIYLMIVGVLAPPIETILAVTASFGIAMGFASQDILKNIFGGIMILFDNPFQVGDKIQVGEHYGEVIHIGLRSVRIVTPDDSTVSIPNSDIVSRSVSNSNTGEFNCQVVAEFYFPIDVDLEKLRKLATRAAIVSKYVYLRKPVAVRFKNEIHEGRSMVKMRLKAYVLDLRYEFAFSTEMSEIVISEVLKQGLVTPQQMSG